VSISNSKQVSVESSAKGKPGLMQQYQARPDDQETLSLHSFYMWSRERQGKHTAIPHFVGVSGNPCYPVSKGYAQHVLVVYKPWRNYPNPVQWKLEFNRFIKSPSCPPSCALTYKRVMQRHYEGTQFVEPKTHQVDHTGNPLTAEDEEALLLLGLGGKGASIVSSFDNIGIHKGVGFDWGCPPKVNPSCTVYTQIQLM
jgi:hypothetical protein